MNNCIGIEPKLEPAIHILYLLSRIVAPVNFPTLIDLALPADSENCLVCQTISVMDYLAYADALDELINIGYVLCEDELYSITERGTERSENVEHIIPDAVREKSEDKLRKLDTRLCMDVHVNSEVLTRPDGAVVLRLSIDSEGDALLSLEISAPSTYDAELLGAYYRSRPECIYPNFLQMKESHY